MDTKRLLIFFLSLGLIKFATAAHAEVRPEAATVLTGQVIPAFIGGAYDPSEAFKQLAGLPIYVFAYDAFQGSNQVKGNLAVRTQIRADGSFQAQGLFSGSHYGVYFPFRGIDTNNDGFYDTVVRTDCKQGINDTQPHCQGTYKDGNLVVEGAYFRWPESSTDPAKDDKILDVFSYKQNDTRALNSGNDVVVQSQIPCDTTKCSKGFEDVVIERVFATSTTRVDIDNSINVFPVIPVSTVRIDVFPEISKEVGASYDVVAIRVAEEVTTTIEDPDRTGHSKEVTYLRKVNYPVIRGRTTPGILKTISATKRSLASFQAYAPPGYYALIPWRQEAGSLAYKDYNGTSPINSTTSGFGYFKVQKDWRGSLEQNPRDYAIPMLPNRIVVWGIVTKDDGTVMTDSNKILDPSSKPQHRDLNINFFSETNLGYMGPKKINADARYCIWGGRTLPQPTWQGLYAICQYNPPNATTGPRKGGLVNDQNYVYIQEDFYQKIPQEGKFNKTTFGQDGPMRRDLTAMQDKHLNNQPTQNATGFESGIVLDVTHNGQVVRDADVLVIPLGSSNKNSIKAAKSSYGTDINGRVHIPDEHLKKGIDYALQVTSGGRLGFGLIQDYQGYDDTLTAGAAIPLAQVVRTPKPYKILGKIPVPFSIVQAQNFQGTTVTGTLQNSENLKGAQIYIKRVLKNGKDQTCFERKADGTLSEDGTCFFRWTTKNKEFSINFQVPLSIEEIKGRLYGWCRSQHIPKSECDKKITTMAGVSTDAYVLEIKGTMVDETGAIKDYSADYRFVVDDKGVVSPNSVTLDLAIDCSKVDETVLVDLKVIKLPTISAIVNRSACNFTQFVGNKAQGMIGDFQRQFLQIRPLTDAPGIIEAWNLVRALTNVFFILFLIIIGFATIFRWDPKTWSLGLLLPRLIVAIVLANFSLLIVQLLIDVNNLLTHAIFNMGGSILAATKTAAGKEIIAAGSVSGKATLITGTIGTFIAGSLLSSLGSTIALGAATGGLAFIPALISLVSFALTIFIFLLGLFLLWFMRYAVIWIATVVAPLIFALSTFPALESFRKLWFNTLFPFTLMQTVTAIIFTIGLFLLTVAGGTGTLFTDVFTILTALFVLGAALKAPQFTAGLFKGLVSSKAMGAFGEAAGKWKGGYLKDTLTSEKLSEAIGRSRADAATDTGRIGGRIKRIPGVSTARGLFGGMTGSTASRAEQLEGVQAGIKAMGQTQTPQEKTVDKYKDVQKLRAVNQNLRNLGYKPTTQTRVKQFSNIMKYAQDTDTIHGINASGNIDTSASITVGQYRSLFTGNEALGISRLQALQHTPSGMSAWAQNFALTQKYQPKKVD